MEVQGAGGTASGEPGRYVLISKRFGICSLRISIPFKIRQVRA